MDRVKFLERLRASAVKLTPLTLEGWDEPVYLKPQTMADIRETLIDADGAENESLAQRLVKEPYFIERGIARRLHDKDGNRLFDINDTAQMEELRTVLDNNGPAISKQIQDGYNSLIMPSKDEADVEGN